MISIPKVIGIILLVVGGFNSSCYAVHPYHVSYAEVEWNSKTGNFEVALCVWPADLEKALAKQEGKSIDLDKVKDLDSLVQKYVEGKFRIQSAEKSSDSTTKSSLVRWVGHEKDLKKAWLYFEVTGSKERQPWVIQNRLFCEFNDDQENHVQITVDGQIVSLVTGKKNGQLTTLKTAK